MKKINIILILVFVVAIGAVLTRGYFLYQNLINSQKPVACTMDAKVCPDGSAVGRTAPKCEFAPCPDYTVGWNYADNKESGFTLKYPNNFFDVGHEPKISALDCDAIGFNGSCPVSSSLPTANSEVTINNVKYCLSQEEDAGMGHVYFSYDYLTMKDNKCARIRFSTSTTNCSFYLPLENGNTEQAKNYNNCLTKNEAQPRILNEIINTFKFSK